MSESNAPVLELVSISKKYGDFTALDDVSLQATSGSVTCVVGPSGSGKSTMLRTINMLETIDSGAIFFEGHLLGYSVHGNHRRPVSKAAIRRQRLNFGMVFQGFESLSCI